MNKKATHINVYLSFFILHSSLFILLCGCAQVVAPTGGPKDVTPPKALAYSPGNKSTDFNAQKIDITFNKYIQLKNLSKQFIVSPPLKRLPVPVVKGKILEISLKSVGTIHESPLLENTTYTFNFGNAVCDLNEGNQLKNFQYVFSTGAFIDSLSLSGKALDAFSGDPIKDGLVLLYRSKDTNSQLNDSVPYKSIPSYCGQLDDNGTYKIDNIKEGYYKIIAISPVQNDYFYHPYTQEIAFVRTLNIASHHKKDTASLYLFTEEKPVLHLTKAKAAGKGDILLIFNKPADSLKITPLNCRDTIYSVPTHIIQYSATYDSAYYWTNYPGLDSLRFIVSRNNKNIDTAIVYSIPGGKQVKSSGKKKAVPPALPITTNINAKEPFNYHLPFTIQFGNPVLKYNMAKIFFTRRKDTIALKPDTAKMPFIISLQPQKSLLSDSGYHFLLLPGAFTDLFGYTNDTLNLQFRIQEDTYFGSLKLNLSFSKPATYMVQLLDDKNNVYRQTKIHRDTSLLYNALLPALYRIRIIEDDNNNGKWDAGNYLKGIQPEKVYYYSDKINVRSNWDLAQDWKVN